MQISTTQYENILDTDYLDLLKHSVFFDIETTGFSTSNSIIYLIGCSYYANNSWNTIQWFADTPDDESVILHSFLEYIQNFQQLISYNGIAFDIPFIIKRCTSLNIHNDLDLIPHLDLYKAIQPFKKVLALENLKQKTIEKFLTIHRDDLYSGGELIEQYHNFLNNPNSEILNLLLLHNLDDLKGLVQITPMISYKYFLDGIFSIETIMINYEQFVNRKCKNDIIFELFLTFSLPKPVSLSIFPIYITGKQNKIKILIKPFRGELKYFYPNHKDYFYLPQEDMAIHKSVATYVEKDFKEKAKPSTCYTKKEGIFLPQFSEIFSPAFKTAYKDSNSYFEFQPEFFDDKSITTSYIKHIISHCISQY